MKTPLLALFFMFCMQFALAQKDGPHESFYDNGQLKVKGQYENKQPVGEWKSYHPNGQVSSEYSYTNGERDKEYVHYFENGKISNETKKVNGDYITTGYYESGKIQYERILSDGYYKEFSEDGHLIVESNYVDGELSGEWKKFYSSGELAWIVNYLDGYREGVYQHFYKNGQLKLEGKMLRNKKSGEERRYFENGQLEWEGRYKDGNLDKNWLKFDGNGNVEAKLKFENGQIQNAENNLGLQPTEVPDGVLEKVPVYPGCENALTNRLRRQCMSNFISAFVMKKFNTDITASLPLTGQQKIYVIFKIDKEGKVINVDARAPHQELAYEAIRVVNQLPQMQPGYQRGKPVMVPYSLPIVFNIPERRKK